MCSNKTTYITAAVLLIFTFAIAVLTIRNDSLTMDELAHLPAGYSYLTQKDMRLNPEHPPLVKDLSAVPLLFFKDINFPYDSKAWRDDVNAQWDFGSIFMFHSNNPASQMIFWARIPMILILLVLGFYTFKWTRELFGNKAGLLALFLFSFSPTLLAHGRLVTTDVGAATGVVIACYYFLKFLKDSSKKNLIIAGIALGIAELLKFSLILLFPLFGLLILIWAIAKSASFKEFLLKFGKYLLSYILILIIAFVVIGAVYEYHVWNYPIDRQVRDAQFILSSFGNRTLVNINLWMDKTPVLRAWGQYFLGVMMILQRATGGNTTYFMGEVSASGWKDYFPIVYVIKEPLSFIILLAISVISFIILFFKNLSSMRNKIIFYFEEIACVMFIGLYWTTSLTSNLNIGVRHLLPVFPMTIMLVAGIITFWVGTKKTRMAILALLIMYQTASFITAYPHYIAYFSDIIGGSKNGYLYAVDSNLDWGQDLKRLNQWLDKNNIKKVYVDYFGGSDLNYYLDGKYISWQGTNNPNLLPEGSYLAVSATFLQGGRGNPVPGFDQNHGYYDWLNKYTPVTTIGNSIFIYNITE